MIAIFFGAFWKKFTPAGLITTVLGGISLMLLGNRYPQELIGPLAHETPFDPVHPYTYMAALYNLIVCVTVAMVVTFAQHKLKLMVSHLKKNPQHKTIMFTMIVFSIIVILMDILVVIFKFDLGPLLLLFTLTLIMSACIAFITTFYVKYDPELQTAGLTIWSTHKAKEWFKGRKLNERGGENVKVDWKLNTDGNEDIINFSRKDIHKMAAGVGDLVYI